MLFPGLKSSSREPTGGVCLIRCNQEALAWSLVGVACVVPACQMGTLSCRRVQHAQNADRHVIHTDFRSVPGSSERHEHRETEV